MAVAKEIMGISLVQKSMFLPSAKYGLNQNKFWVLPAGVSSEKMKILNNKRVVKKTATTVAAVSEDLVKSVPPVEKAVKFKVRAIVTVRKKIKEDFQETLVNQLIKLFIETRTPKRSNEAVLMDWSKKSNVKAERVNYTTEFIVGSDFGVPGAIEVTNKHQNEFFLETITIEGFACGPVHFPCDSWVQSRKDLPGRRIFFSNQPYLPNETPAGVKALRERDLRNLRGDGEGERKLSDRIYDYDVYNDLGNPDKDYDLVRPTLGGGKFPYPRRCRTGRAPTNTDVHAESRVEKPLPIYVPRDEQFEESKLNTFLFGRLKAVLHTLFPTLVATISKNHDFKAFSDIDSLFNEGLPLNTGLHGEVLKRLPMPKIVNKIQESSQSLLKYDTPLILTKDKFAWLRDDEFARQVIAGINPVSIERLMVFPPVSKLDPEIYGPPESAIKEEHIVGYLDGMSVQQALEENKLYMVDYHDIYLPFLDRINALDDRKAYATRAIFYKTPRGTLKPIAIELSLPYTGPNCRSKRVVTPPVDATANWVWHLAKSHFCTNDAGAHQLVHHWYALTTPSCSLFMMLRTHAAVEPFILAAHRQLSAMHPIFKLLDPHMRYTLQINVLARQSLISNEGVIETCFTPGKYCMQISASAYKNFWRFDLEGLPSDLIRRGMAVADPTQPHGLRLLLEDYPYANDGLLIWEAIEKWVRIYVNRYYPDASVVQNDTELQAWYWEAKNVGHADLRNETWWPKLENTDDLIKILTILIWLSSAQHAALNFAQYPYGGYMPNRSPIMRRLIPEESDAEYENFVADPHKYFLLAMPSMLQATKYMAVVDSLSTHSPDEEYLGERSHQSIWTGDAEMVEAFYEFSAEIQKLEKEIEKRNKNPNLRNRCGAGVLPYELLAPSSEPGVTCRGVPNSVSI
ncbi:PLAT/LH2 domain [Dillenia turbinata]|uniref:Lipoxygenase n=1 Tax=Dillenia turbinata TaxID=194707 RepID=A0AAN8UNV0_9MAGN